MWWEDFQREIHQGDKVTQTKQRVRNLLRSYGDRPDVYARLSDWADHAPTLPSGVLVSFAQAGISPTSTLGRWAIGNATVAINAQDQPKRNTDWQKTYQQSQEMLSFLGNRGTVADLARLDKKARNALFNYEGDPFGLDHKQLSRMAQHKNPNPGPGGFGGIVHDIGSAGRAVSRDVFGAMQAPYEATFGAGLRGTTSAVAGGLNVAKAPLEQPVGGGQSGAFGQSGIQGGLLPAGTPVAPQAPEYYKFGHVRVASDIQTATDPKQITIWNMLHGDNAGQGFFPGGQAQQAQIQASQNAAFVELPDGQRSALTAGRLIAQTIVEPGSKPYRVVSGMTDLGASVYGDPTNIAFSALSNVRNARKLFTPEAAGAYTGLRKYVHGPTFTQWADSKAGQAVFDHVANTTDIRTLNRQLGENFPAEMLPALQDAKTADQVKTLVHAAVDNGLSPRVPTWGYDWGKLTQNIRWLNQMPTAHGVLDFEDTRNNLDQIERWLVLNKVPGDQIEKILSKTARVQSYTDLADLMYHDVSKTLIENAQRYGLDEHDARSMFSFEKSRTAATKELALDEVGNPLRIDVPPTIDGVSPSMAMFGPTDDAQLLNRGIFLPSISDLRTQRHRMSALSHHGLTSKLWNSSAIDGVTAAGDAFFGDFWKPLALMRAAWPLRVIGEEQVRIAGSGHDSAFSHPASWIAHVIGKKGDYSVLNTSFEDVMDEATNLSDISPALSGRGQTGLLSVGRNADQQILGGYAQYRSMVGTGQEAQLGFTQAWEDNILQLRASKVHRAIAQDLRDVGNTDNVVERLMNGDLKPVREDMMKAKLWDHGASEQILATREGTQAWVNSLEQRMRALTRGDPDLIDGVADGKGLYLSGNGSAISKEMRGKLNDLLDAGDAPEKLTAHERVQVGKLAKNNKWDRFVSTVFNGLMTVPTNKLSRSPQFKQAYWDSVRTHIRYAQPEAQAAIKDVFDNTVDIGYFKHGPLATRETLAIPAESGKLDLHTLHTLAKSDALESTKQLLYDAANKGNGWDGLRFVFPFGEAFKEVTTRWAKLVWDNPRLLRRFQQGLYGLRGSGFFQTDPNDGHEYFTYPFSEKINKAVTGLPFPMRGQVSSLNVIGQGLPSVGPAIQIPASKLIPQDPKWDWIKQYIDPYGDPQGDAIDALMPGWGKKLRAEGAFGWMGVPASEGDQRVFENAVKDASTYLASSHSYDLSSQDGLNKLADDARSMAKRLYTWRSIVQFAAPAAPQVVPKMKGKDGGLFEIYQVAQDYQRMLAKNDGDWSAATMEFIDKYGATSYLALEPRGQRQVYGVPTTKESEAWRATHKQFAENHPNTYGYFAPQGGKFDYAAYQRAIERGDIGTLSVKEWLNLANARVGSAIESSLRAKLPPNPSSEQLDWLAGKRKEIGDQFYGYFPKDTLKTSVSLDHQIKELRDAVRSPTVRNTDLAKATKTYLTLRDKALKAVGEARGMSPDRVTLSSQTAAPYRSWLRDMGEKLIAQAPEFTTIWDGVFSYEVRLTDSDIAQGAP